MDLGYEWKEEEMRIHWDDAATKVGEGDRNGVRSAQRNEKHAGRGLTGANANGPQPESAYLTRPHPLLRWAAEYDCLGAEEVERLQQRSSRLKKSSHAR